MKYKSQRKRISLIGFLMLLASCFGGMYLIHLRYHVVEEGSKAIITLNKLFVADLLLFLLALGIMIYGAFAGNFEGRRSK